MIYKNIRILLITTLLLLCLHGLALAHKVSIYGYIEDERVYTESYFAGGGRCAGCVVRIADPSTGELMLSGTTDDEGRFDFDAPGGGALELRVDAGGGHMGSFTLEIEGQREVTPNTQALPSEVVAGGTPRVLEDVLEEKLNPIRRELISLREAQERPGITEILGGIGYIIGLLGLWAYMKSRKKEE